MTPAPQPHREPRDPAKRHGVTRHRILSLEAKRRDELAAGIAAKASAASDESAKRLANAERASGRARAVQ